MAAIFFSVASSSSVRNHPDGINRSSASSGADTFAFSDNPNAIYFSAMKWHRIGPFPFAYPGIP